MALELGFRVLVSNKLDFTPLALSVDSKRSIKGLSGVLLKMCYRSSRRLELVALRPSRVALRSAAIFKLCTQTALRISLLGFD